MVKAMLVNPFYAINISPKHADIAVTHISNEMWIDHSAGLIREKGAQAWLDAFLAQLESNQPNENLLPFPVAPALCFPHEPLVTRDEWIQLNTRMIEESGPKDWLRRVIMVLSGH